MLGRHVAFASELQALRHIPNAPRELTSGRWINTYSFITFLAPTRSSGIFASSCLHTNSISVRRHLYRGGEVLGAQIQAFNGKEFGGLAEGLDADLKESVRAHLGVRCFLRGFSIRGLGFHRSRGVHSDALEEPVKTFTIGFEEKEYDELSYARRPAANGGPSTMWKSFQPDAVAIQPKLTKHYGEPFGDSSAIPPITCRN